MEDDGGGLFLSKFGWVEDGYWFMLRGDYVNGVKFGCLVLILELNLFFYDGVVVNEY